MKSQRLNSSQIRTGKTDRQTDRQQTDRQTDRQTDKKLLF